MTRRTSTFERCNVGIDSWTDLCMPPATAPSIAAPKMTASPLSPDEGTNRRRRRGHRRRVDIHFCRAESMSGPGAYGVHYRLKRLWDAQLAVFVLLIVPDRSSSTKLKPKSTDGYRLKSTSPTAHTRFFNHFFGARSDQRKMHETKTGAWCAHTRFFNHCLGCAKHPNKMHEIAYFELSPPSFFVSREARRKFFTS